MTARHLLSLAACVAALWLAGFLTACQPAQTGTGAGPDTRTAASPPVELLEASGEGRVVLSVSGQRVSVDLESGKTPGGICSRVRFGWGPLEVGGLEHGACGEAAPVEDVSPAPAPEDVSAPAPVEEDAAPVEPAPSGAEDVREVEH